MNSATIAFRVKPEIKKRADALFERLGMTTSTGMNILLMQTLEHRGFAAPIALPRGSAPSDKERANLSRDIEISRREFAEGKGIPSDEVFREMDEMIKGWMRKRSRA